MSRTVLYAEVPFFYATVERASDPSLVGRPVIVGGDPRKNGRVQAVSVEAAAAGVAPEMSVLEALRLCPGARAVRTDRGRYTEVSRRFVGCLRRVHPQLEVFSRGGAAWLELRGGQDPEALAERLREAVREDLDLPLRVGIASGKFLARIAAEEAGGAGVLRVAPGGEAVFLGPLAASRLDGVGPKTAARLAELGAVSIADVAALGRERLEEAFGAHGLRILALARARDDAPVRASRQPGSLSREQTFREAPVADRSVLLEALQDLARQLSEELDWQGLAALRVGLKVAYDGQGQHNRSQAQPRALRSATEIAAAAAGLLDRTQAGSAPVRRLGLQLGKLVPAAESDRQLDLFLPEA